MEVTQPVERAPKRAKWIAAGAFILLGIGGLAALAVASPGAVSYYATPSEIDSGEADATRHLRLGGRVAEDSLDRDGAVVTFVVTDGHSEVPVRYAGEVPDTLQDATDVIAEGRLSPDGTLVADRVLAKCSSKFVPAEDVEEHLGRG